MLLPGIPNPQVEFVVVFLSPITLAATGARIHSTAQKAASEHKSTSQG